MNLNIKKYQKKSEYSYTLGAFPTIELLENKPKVLLKVLLSSKLNNSKVREYFYKTCKEKNIEIIENDKLISRISSKENCYVIGAFRKYKCDLDGNQPHIVLVNPSDTGNIGTILRTSIGFGIHNLAIIEPAVDIFNPKVIRGSMGAIFKINFFHFSSFEEYHKKYVNHKKYLFMLQGATNIENINFERNKPYSLVFGNEANGLDTNLKKFGESIFIKHNNLIDSLNLSIASGIAIYKFTLNKN